MKSMKFLLMFVLMLSIASVNVDAQRRRSYSRSRTTQARKAPAKKTNAESEYYSTGYHRKTDERVHNAAKYCDNNLPTSEHKVYLLNAIISEGNHLETAKLYAFRIMGPYGISFTCISNNGNTRRYRIGYQDSRSDVPLEFLTTIRSDGNEFITKVWRGYYDRGY